MQEDSMELTDAILEEAAVWLVQLREAPAGTSEEGRVWSDFRHWLLADSRHRQAFAEMEAVWGALQIPVEQILAEQQITEEGVGDEAFAASCANPAPPQSGRYRSGWSQRLAIAACLVLVVSAVLGWQGSWLARVQSDYMTSVGETAPIEMADGSRITLNTDSALTTDYGNQERRVRLLKGEAWFDVASTDPRPFVVSTDSGLVRVRGTRFNVSLVDDKTTVSLDEGRVELWAGLENDDSGRDELPVELEPGQQAVLVANAVSTPISFDRTAVTAWLRGQLVFYNTPLGEVVNALNRYRQGRIVLASSELENFKVSGVFSTNAPDAALDVIVATLPIRQIRLTDFFVLLH